MKKKQADVVMAGVGSAVPPGPEKKAETRRPRYILEGHEDEVYHEGKLAERGREPEYCAFVNQSWTFNRAMRWLEPGNGTLLCYSAGGDLALTGTKQVSSWFSDPVNLIERRDSNTFFRKKSNRSRDCLVLPGLQFHLEQHPEVELIVSEASADWQFCVMVKGRSAAPLLSSGWHNGPKTLSYNLAEALKQKGYTLHFTELHFVLGVWTGRPEKAAAIGFSLRLKAKPAVVTCLPVIRTTKTMAARGAAFSALVVDSQGNLLGRKQVSLKARLGRKELAPDERNGIWTTVFSGLTEEGDHHGRLSVEGAVRAETDFTVRVTSGNFYDYSPAWRSLTHAGKPIGPLSGSAQMFVYVRNAGLKNETMVQGQAQWDAWDRSRPPGEHWHYWEALTAAELENRFKYLEKSGWNLLHLLQHCGIWEKLDVGGRIAPHGAEQLALFLRTADRHKLVLLQALSHYPYGSKSPTATPPVQQYLEAGFKDPDWFDPAAAFTKRFHDYLRHFAVIFREETALFAMSTSGEGDHLTGAARVNDTHQYISSIDPNHLFVSEPIHQPKSLPCERSAGWNQKMFGSRMYWIGEDIEPEIDLGIAFKFLQTGNYFMGEGSWPHMSLYNRFMGRLEETWAGTERYRTRVRDSIYLGLVHRCPIILTWDEQQTEEERIVFNRVRQTVDWSQEFMESPVGIRVDTNNVNWSGPDAGRAVLANYEKYFSGLPLSVRYLLPDNDIPAGIRMVIDAGKPFREPGLPDALKDFVPLEICGKYRCSYLWSADRKTLLAYIYNCNRHQTLPCEALAGSIHRLPRPAKLEITLRHPALRGLTGRLFDLNAKRGISKRKLTGHQNCLSPGNTGHDYFFLVTPY